jgi:hypothetical protein
MNDSPRPDDKESNFGMVRRDFTPKPLAMVVAAMTRLLGNATFLKDLSTEPQKYRAYLFDASGTPVFSAWTVEGKRDISLAVDGDEVEIIDVMGNSRKAPVSDGNIKLTLSEIPIYVKGVSPSVAKILP